MFEAVTLADRVWTPTLDTGRNSLYPDLASRLYSKGRFARLPFIAGTNRDEGTLFASQQPLTDEVLKAVLIAANASPDGSASALGTAMDKVLELYPTDPAVGSPYGTGDELFGLPASYKRHASISKSIHGSDRYTSLELSTTTFASGRYDLRCAPEDVVSSGREIRRQVLQLSLYRASSHTSSWRCVIEPQSFRSCFYSSTRSVQWLMPLKSLTSMAKFPQLLAQLRKILALP
jgi:hypothetical protein